MAPQKLSKLMLFPGLLITFPRSLLGSNRRKKLLLWFAWLKILEEREKLKKVVDVKVRRFSDREKTSSTKSSCQFIKELLILTFKTLLSIRSTILLPYKLIKRPSLRLIL
jgi:hypothetical protein